MKFDREPPSKQLLDEMMPLIKNNVEETSVLKAFECRPNLTHYLSLNLAGILRLYTARQAGKLAGYSILNIYKHPQFPDSVHAQEEVIFIDKEYRKGSTGIKFIKFIDESLKAEGVHIIHHTVSSLRGYDKVLLRMGYTLADKVYVKNVSERC